MHGPGLEAVRRFIKSSFFLELEAMLVFSDLVPLHFADLTDRHLIRITQFEELASL